MTSNLHYSSGTGAAWLDVWSAYTKCTRCSGRVSADFLNLRQVRVRARTDGHETRFCYFCNTFVMKNHVTLDVFVVPLQSWTIKDNKKKLSNRSPIFSIRIDAYQLGEDPDKISLKFNELFLRKLPFKEIGPWKHGNFPKSRGKILKKCGIDSF